MKYFRKISHKAIAGFLMIWLSGVVFLLCCTEINANTDEEFCPLARMSADCDNAETKKDSQAVTNQTDEQGMDCCAFLPPLFDKGRTIETNQKVEDVPPVTAIEGRKPLSVHAPFTSGSFYNSTVRFKNNTFLKNRTFRI